MMKRTSIIGAAARIGLVLLLMGGIGLLCLQSVSHAQDAGPEIPEEVKQDADDTGGGQTLDEVVEGLFRQSTERGDATTAAQDDQQDVDADVEADVRRHLGAGPRAGDEAPLQPATPVVEPEPTELSENERVRRMELEMMADELAVQALKLWRQGEFKQARDRYEDALSRLDLVSESQPRVLKKKEQIRTMLHNLHSDWAAELVREAQQLVSVAKIEQGIEKLNLASRYDPTRREEIDERIRRYLELKREMELKEKTKPEQVDLEAPQREFSVRVLIEQGKVFLKNRRYGDARDKFEKALLEDPYNITAIRHLAQINKELVAISDEKKEEVISERIAEVRWKWAEPVNPVMSDAGPDARSQIIAKGEATSGIRAKLNNIIIPHVEYDEIPISEVIIDLKQQSMELDVEDGTGVNILLQTRMGPPRQDLGPQSIQPDRGGGMDGFDDGFGAGGGFGEPGLAEPGMGGMEPGFAPEPGMGAEPGFGAPPMAMEPGFAEPGMAPGGGFEDFGMGEFGMEAGPAAAAPAAQGVADRTVTMQLDNVPLGDVIDYVGKLAGLKHRVEEHAVIMADQSVPFETLETRFYNVAAGVFDSQRTRRRAESIDWGSDGDTSTTRDDDDDRRGDYDDDDDGDSRYMINVDAFFHNLGVTFPAGARLSYFQRQGKLIVHNTPDNHRKIQMILAEINETPKLVTIEAKFVEVMQTNLETLGFDWMLTAGGVSYNPGTGSGDHFLFSDVTGRNTGIGSGNFQTGVQKGADLTGGLRFAQDFFTEVTNPDNIFSTYTILGNYAFETIVHALEQQAHGDVLSSPKVTTLSGTTAILRMVTERYFPESWSEPEIVTQGSADNTSVTIQPSIPEFGDARDIGVILEVLPTVASDNYSIDLELEPEVIDFIAYDDEFNYTMVLAGESVTAKTSMPILSARTVQTKVIVWDGETVVLGGMIRERVDKFQDKVPFLGDVPMLGRLFRSDGERSEKINLLIFVTARLVDPSGRPLRPNEVRGLPDFRR